MSGSSTSAAATASLHAREECLKLLEVLKATADANQATAQAAACLAATMVPSSPSPSPSSALASPSTPAPRKTPFPSFALASPSTPAPRKIGSGPFVLHERVGTITAAAWKNQSQDKLKELDGVLRGIVDRVCLPGVPWDVMGVIIRERLAAFGFQFSKPEETPPSPNWGEVYVAGGYRIPKVDALLDCSRAELGDHWYTDEMLRVLRQLMELRDFRP